MAASFIILARSAPTAPEVARAISSKSTVSSSRTSLEWTFRIFTRPFRSGLSTMTRRSNRPGLKSAGSRISGRLVAAITRRPLEESKPSISERSWFKVCSLSSFPPNLESRLRPMASISSIKMIQGADCWACLNRSRTRDAPTPTNISTKSEPDRE